MWVFNSTTSLIDITGVDSSQLVNYNSFFLSEKLVSGNNKLIIYNFINYFINCRLLIVFFNDFLTKFFSIENAFLNSNWPERELIEFFGVEFFFKKDTRNLLLDYTFVGNPLLKTFPTEGYEELYFNFNNYSLSYISNEFVEL
jgi:NADH:ubiquinone oxidoreductase subunit C